MLVTQLPLSRRYFDLQDIHDKVRKEDFKVDGEIADLFQRISDSLPKGKIGGAGVTSISVQLLPLITRGLQVGEKRYGRDE